ncbi:MAG: ABC transporter permease [Actinomycetales bacterium]|nr:ABC transporter permease [Actinomycetales bacterium]
MSADAAQTDLGISGPDPRRELRTRAQAVIVPLVSVLIAFAIGGILIWLQGVNPLVAYKVLFTAALGNEQGLTRVMEKSTPLILTGLAVVVGLRAGLFNIGAQGQLLVAAIGAAWAGYAFQLPAIIHLPFALVFGMLCGAAWASIAGVLRAYRSVSEVITTIMLNAIAIALVDYLASEPLKEADQPLTRTPAIQSTAALPDLGIIPMGFVIALAVAILLGWFLSRTTGGFRFNTVGLNPNAARYAGISVRGTIVLAMAVSGALAGLGGAIETVGITGRFEPAFNAGLGFDGITIALLARANPIATIPAAILVGILRTGAASLQFETGIQPEVVDVILALTLLMVAAPIVGRLLFRNRALKATRVTSGWGS